MNVKFHILVLLVLFVSLTLVSGGPVAILSEGSALDEGGIRTYDPCLSESGISEILFPSKFISTFGTSRSPSLPQEAEHPSLTISKSPFASILMSTMKTNVSQK
ncbi:hypothetical protein chiPu_0008806 [Chiloscyllium punctatum]|uniref:Uncharacterized protein n=1 Tax=Chiloscyllium punctatum TaxID=137246 RepID=A0A401SIY3_CHIPU|nr:hypothetical protein [Chiloscyllium punctatum]